MAIKINNINYTDGRENVYSDIHFDLEVVKKDGGSRFEGSVVNGKDVVIDTNESAIRNSLINLMTTKQGQRPLLLNYGLNLYKFLGDPIVPATANAIGTEIRRGIDIWEPRVRLVNLFIFPNEDQLMYEIMIILNLINLPNSELKLGAELSRATGFKFVDRKI